MRDESPKTLQELLYLQSDRNRNKLAYAALSDDESICTPSTFGQLRMRAESIAATIRTLCKPGDRALLLYPQGVEFVEAFFACILAGVVAVPAHCPPSSKSAPERHTLKLFRIIEDCRPSIVLCSRSVVSGVGSLLAQDPLARTLPTLPTDSIPTMESEERGFGLGQPSDVATLIYTSGSTGDPKGVTVLHRNVLRNLRLVTDMFGNDAESSYVSWLPLYHDLGLVVVMLSGMYCGSTCYLMDPESFISKPIRWLRAISRYRARNAGGPNFAFDLCVRKTTAAERAGLELSCWQVAFNGAEPVRSETLSRFTETFAPYGFQDQSHYPCYGMAEATGIITGGRRQTPPRVLSVGEAALQSGHVDFCSEGNANRTLVGCGHPGAAETLLIVNPETAERCQNGEIGEVWIAGDSIGPGYFRRPQATAETFFAHIAGADSAHYLRTGDLGFVQEGELYLTGRLKDLIIVRGGNHYPQDIEHTAEQTHPAIRPGGCAAFAIDNGQHEQLGLVAELNPEAAALPELREQILRSLRATIGEQHGLQPEIIALVAPRTVLKTTSGKTRRRATRDALLTGQLPTLDTWRAAPSSRHANTEGTPDHSAPSTWSQLVSRLPQLDSVNQRAEIQRFLRHQIAAVLSLSDADSFSESVPFTALGMDSLLAVELQNRLAKGTGLSLQATLGWEFPSLAALVDHFLIQVAPAQITPPAPSPPLARPIAPNSALAGRLIPLRTTGAKRPLFLIPGVEGLASAFLPLAALLDSQRPLYSFQAPGLEPGERPLSSVESLASYFIEALTMVPEPEAYLLLGYSFGCQVAFEMARQLEGRGKRVERILMLDPGMPALVPANSAPLQKVPDLHTWVTLLSKLIGQPLSPSALAGVTGSELIKVFARHVSGDDPREIAAMQETIERRIRVMSMHLVASNSYPTVLELLGEKVGAPIAMLRAQDAVEMPFRNHASWGELSSKWGSDLEWGSLTSGGCQVESTPGDHLSMLKKPHVEILAATIERLLSPQPLTDSTPERSSSTPSKALEVGAAVAEGVPFPLSRGQERFWFLEHRDPGSAAYQLYIGLQLSGPLNLAALRTALQALVQRHPALRTVIAENAGQVQQQVLPTVSIDLNLHAAETEDLDPRSALSHWVKQSSLHPFDLRNGPLLRTHLLQLGPTEHLLLLGAHHIVMDAWSIGVMLFDLAVYYRARVTGSREHPQALQHHYADVVRRERNWLQSADAEKSRAYWKTQLQGLPPLELPTDRPVGTVRSSRGGAVQVVVPRSLFDSLHRLSAQEGCTPFAALLSVWATLLSRISGQTDFGIGTVVANRSQPEWRDLVGYFVNTLVLRCKLDDGPSFRTLLGRLRGTILQSFLHESLPYDEVVRQSGVSASSALDPLIQVALVYEGFPERECPIPNMKWTPLLLTPDGSVPETAKFDLTLTLAQGEDGLSGSIFYSADLFDRSRIERLAAQFLYVLAQVVSAPDVPVHSLPIVLENELQTLRALALRPTTPFVQSTLAVRFAYWAEQTPDALAVTCEGKSLSYQELNRRANRVAHQLVALGVAPEVRVGVCLPRSVELLVALLGVLKAGGAYVPLDPDYPAERLGYIISDAGMPLVVTLSAHRDVLPSTAQLLCLDQAIDPSVERSADEVPSSRVTPSSLAYVIYTSGSTGKPKGVQVTHGNVTRLFTATESWFHFGPSDVWTLFHSYAFDFSVWEIWGALLYGGRLVVVPQIVSRTPDLFYQLLADERVTVLNQTPSAFHQLTHTEESLPADSRRELALRYIIFGGEALDLRSLRPWFVRHGDSQPQLINMYGITETTVHVTYRPLTMADSEQPASWIGRPIPDLQLYVLDRNQQLVPMGIPGELYVGGEGVSRGYLNRPELDRERFLLRRNIPALTQLAHDGAAEDRIYRSGDLARVTPSGDVEYLGRIDNQVKIRGFRIELGEIESALQMHPGVQQAAVLVEEGANGHRWLRAFYVPTEQGVAPTELRTHLIGQLPDYMVPASFEALTSLPLNENGKLDRKALRSRAAQSLPVRTQVARRFVPPETPQQALLAELWQDILRCGPVGLYDSFFALGGDSIQSIRMLARARQAGFSFTLPQVFRHATIHALLQATASGVEPTPITTPFGLLTPEDRARLPNHVDLEDAYPLAALQLGMFFHTSMNERSGVYHDLFSYQLRTPLDLAALRAALAQVVVHHPMLRTSFALSGYSEPLQLVHRQAVVPLAMMDVSAHSLVEQERTVADWFESERQTGFDLMQAPLLRVQIHRRSDTDWNLSVSFHHAILDGWSNALMLTEILTRYTALRIGRTLPLPSESEYSYRSFVALERSVSKRDGDRAFWQKQIRETEFVQLPRWPAKTPPKEGESGLLTISVPSEVTIGLTQLARSVDVPLKSILLAGHLWLLATICNSEEGQTGLVTNGRLEEVGGEQVIGLFLNTVPIRLRMGNVSWRTLALQAFQTECEILSYRRFPLSEIQKLAGGGPVFDTGFNFVHFHVLKDTANLDDLAIVKVRVFERHNYTLAVIFSLDALTGQLTVNMAYDASALPDWQVQQIAQGYQRTLAAMARDPNGNSQQFSLLSEVERGRLLHDFGALPYHSVATEYPSVLELFATQVDHRPNSTAVVCHSLADTGSEKIELTYQELDRRSSQLAHYLRSLGVDKEIRVGVFLPRSAELVISFLAVLKSGGAYVPLDPAYPVERLAYMLADSRPLLLLTQSTLLGKSGLALDGMKVVALDSEAELLSQQPTDSPHISLCDEDLAYVIYTSGTTGRPNGVLVPHRGLPNLYFAQREAFVVEPDSRVFQFASASFDASVSEFLMALCSGAALHLLVRETPASPAELVELLRSQAITHITLPPSLLALFPEVALPALQSLIVAGEPCPPILAARYGKGRRFLNAYGPTEATVCASIGRLTPHDATDAVLHAGRPMKGTEIFILNAQLLPVPQGTPGELYIGGIGVARGYQNQPELTAKKFLPSPFGPGRIYRTGDRARFRPDGNIELLGRVDDQVKLRGFRIEPEEIRSLLNEHPGVQDSAVIVRPSGTGDKQLVAYFSRKTPIKTEASLSGAVELWPSTFEFPILDEVLYHAMTTDAARMRSYRTAIAKCVPGKIVVEIGTGPQAALAVLCAQSGAKKIYAIELDQMVAEQARIHVENRGLQEQIEVICGDARTVQLPELADVCLSAIVGAIGGTEGSAVILNDAQRLLRPSGVMLPQRTITHMGAVTLPDEIYQSPRFSDLGRHYQQKIFQHVGRPFDLRLCLVKLPQQQLLSSTGVMEDLDFSALVPHEEEHSFELRIEKNARLDGLLAWVEVVYTDGVALDLWERNQSHMSVFFPVFEESIHVEVGDVLRVHCRRSLAADGLHPDYGLQGTLLRTSGEQISFSYDAPQFPQTFKAHPFYRKLFDFEEQLQSGESKSSSGAPTVMTTEQLVTELRNQLRKRLPEYMVPSLFMEIEKLPTTPSGKLDRRSLPEPSTQPSGNQSLSPQTDLEREIATIWCEVLQVPTVGVRDNFFDIGGHSLLLMLVLNRLRENHFPSLEITELFEHPTISSLADYLQRKRKEQSAGPSRSYVPEAATTGSSEVRQKRLAAREQRRQARQTSRPSKE